MSDAWESVPPRKMWVRLPHVHCEVHSTRYRHEAIVRVMHWKIPRLIGLAQVSAAKASQAQLELSSCVESLVTLLLNEEAEQWQEMLGGYWRMQL
jgi:ribosomal protein L17